LFKTGQNKFLTRPRARATCGLYIQTPVVSAIKIAVVENRISTVENTFLDI